MSRVDLEFSGSSRGAVTASTEVAQQLATLKETARTQARETIGQQVQQRQSLERMVVAYKEVASNAKRGSETQVAAAKLEQRALAELSSQHGVYMRSSRASTTALKENEQQMERFTKGAALGSGALGRLSRTAGLASGAFLGGVGVIAVFKSAISQGGALQKQLERTDAVWGKNAQAVKAWSEGSAKALGVARADALDAANTIGTLLKNMDVAPPKAQAMSKSIVQLASDMAAFKGVKPEVALAALESGLQGRTRSLKQFGIVLDQTTIKQEAERLGLVKNTVDLGKVKDAELAVAIARQKAADAAAKHGPQSVEEAAALVKVDAAERSLAKAQAGHAEQLTNEQKALSTYNLLMKQTADQQGTWKRRSSDLAGQEQILHAQVKDLQEELGTALIPQLTKYLPMLTAWIDRNQKNGTFQRDFNKIAKDTGAIVGGAITVAKDAVKVWKAFSDAVGGDKQALELLAGFMVGSKLLGAFATLKTNLGLIRLAAGEKGAAGAVGLLSSRLGALGAIQIAAISIPIDIVLEKGIKGKIKQGLGGTAASIYDNVVGFLTQGNIGHNPFDYLVPKGGGGSQQTSTTQKILNAAGSYGGGQYVSGGGHGGVETPNVARNRGLDCSGFITQVFAAAGFKGFGGTTWTILAQLQAGQGPNWYAQEVAAGQVKAGDIAFANNAGHVGLVIGGSGASARILAYSSPNAGGAGEGEKVDQMSSYWGPFYRVFLVDTAAAVGVNNGGDVPHSSQTADVTQTTGASTTPKKTGGGSTVPPLPATTFVEKAKKAKLTPLGRAIQSGQKTVGDDLAAINDDIKKNALPASLGTYLEQRGKEIQKALKSATDPAQIKQQVADFKKLLEDALRLPADVARIEKDLAAWHAAVKQGLLPASLEKDLEARALAINAKLADDLNNPAKFKADERALHQIEQTAQLYLTAIKDGLADRSKMAEIATSFAQSINQALGRVPQMSMAQVDGVKHQMDQITDQLANPKGLSKSQISALQARFSQLAKVYQDGLSQIQQQVSDGRSKFETEWQRTEDQQLTLFDQSTQDHLSAMQRAAQKALAQLQVTVKGAGFASFLYGGDITQTPTEKLIAQLTQAHDDAAAQAQLASDQAAGNTQATAEDEYQMKLTQLQRQAQAERDAADKQLQTAQDNFQQQEQVAEDAYSRERDQQRTHLQEMFDDYLKAVEDGQIPLSQALAALGDATGGALTAAFVAQLDAAYQAMIDLAEEAWRLAGIPVPTELIRSKIPTAPGFKGGKFTQGFASGGWAGRGSPTIDPRDTIPAMLRHGEYVMSPEEVAAGRPDWADGGDHHHYNFAGATFVGAPTRDAAESWARPLKAAIDRVGTGMKVRRT